MKWYEKPEILDYIVRSYAGIDVVDGKRKRQFIWEEDTGDNKGDILIGNARAFTDHVSKKFDLRLSSTVWSSVHEALRAMGEIANVYSPRTQQLGHRFRNQEPESHVLRRKSQT